MVTGLCTSTVASITSGTVGAARSAANAIPEQEMLDHFEVLQRGAVRLTGHDQDAEDLVQETYLRASRSIHQFRPGTNLRAWLFRIMVNLYRDARRPMVGAPRSVSLEAERPEGAPTLVETLPSRLPAVEEQVLATSQLEWLSSELAALPAQFAQAVYLADLEDRSYDEIAAVTGVGRNTVGSRVFRGRALLRERLRRTGE